MILVGYENNSTNYRLLDPETKKITVSRHVIFNETTEVNSNVQTTTIHNPSQHEEDLLLEEDGQSRKKNQHTQVTRINLMDLYCALENRAVPQIATKLILLKRIYHSPTMKR